jgi:hypothetical protein
MSKYSMEGYNKFQAEWRNESDRAAIILAASYLYRYLGELLAAAFVDDKVSRQLLKRNPLSSYAARIDLAFALGRIGDIARDQLHVLREMRNLCAHEDQSLTFESKEIKDFCDRLSEPLRQAEVVNGEPTLKPLTFKGTRDQFLTSVFFIFIHLETQKSRITPPKISGLDYIISTASFDEYLKANKNYARFPDNSRIRSRSTGSRRSPPDNASREKNPSDRAE